MDGLTADCGELSGRCAPAPAHADASLELGDRRRVRIKNAALAHRPEVEETVMLPKSDEPVRYSEHIKSLFRQKDRQSMKWAFDLWSYPDVKSHGAAILQRLQAGTMPCDGAWPQERLEVFQRWVESGMPE